MKYWKQWIFILGSISSLVLALTGFTYVWYRDDSVFNEWSSLVGDKWLWYCPKGKYITKFKYYSNAASIFKVHNNETKARSVISILYSGIFSGF